MYALNLPYLLGTKRTNTLPHCALSGTLLKTADCYNMPSYRWNCFVIVYHPVVYVVMNTFKVVITVNNVCTSA